MVACLAAPLACVGSSAASGSVSSLRLVPIVSGLRAPLYVTAPRSEPRRLYVLEQRGLVRVVAGGRLLPRPFLDLRGLVLHKELAGLLSLAFAPDYRRSRRLYVHYVGRDGDLHVVEYRSGGRRVRELLHVLVPAKSRDNHYGGQLEFGPDGFLYVGIGDGNTKAAAQIPRACWASSSGSTSAAARRSRRSSPTGSATPGASRSTARPATSTSAMSGPTRGRRWTSSGEGRRGR